MPNIFDEVKIIFRGPCERLFIAYKPLGWHVCSPSGKKKMDDSLSSVIGAKLRISEDSIKFPSKLKINQKGLVIGTTDEPMYNQICKMIERRECSKTYSCLIEDSTQSFLSKNKDLRTLLDNTSNLNNNEITGSIEFNLRKLQKYSQSDPDVAVDLEPTSNPYSVKFKINNLTNILNNTSSNINTATSSINNNTDSNSSSTNKTTTSSSNKNNNYNVDYNYDYNLNSLSFDINKYTILELETRDKLVDKYLLDILDKIGVKLVDQLDSITNERHKIMHLNKIQIPHPILRDRRITTNVLIPLETWIQHLSKYN